MTNLATKIQTYFPSVAEVQCAAALVTSGYLAEDVMTTLATWFQSSLTNPKYKFSIAELNCAAALATSGFLSEDVLSAADLGSQGQLDCYRGEWLCYSHASNTAAKFVT